jgi:hypothetical protein
VKKIISIFCICCFFPFGATLKAQKDADIKKAKTEVTNADNALKKFRKFTNNDSVHWLLGGDATLTFSATSLTNWVNGGEDQIGVNSVVNVFANYKKGKRTFENYGTFAYGLLKKGERRAVKNDDRLHFVSKVGHQISPKWYYTASFLSRTQFAPGYKYTAKDTIKISDFLNPINLFLSVGVDYRPGDQFSAVISPVMGKSTFALSDDLTILGNAGLVETIVDEEGKNVVVPKKPKYEFGGGILLTLKGNMLKNRVSYNSTLDLFSNYMVNPQNVDVNWTFNMKILIYKNISADIQFLMKYDDDQSYVDKTGATGGPRLQTQNKTGVSIFYQF